MTAEIFLMEGEFLFLSLPGLGDGSQPWDGFGSKDLTDHLIPTPALGRGAFL